MRRKSPEDFRKCVAAFLDEAVDTRATQICSLWIVTADDFLDSFRAAVRISATRDELRSFLTITEAQFERCLDWVVGHRNVISGLADLDHFHLSRDYHVSWQCASERQVPLISDLKETYGTWQHLGTHFQFAGVSEYYQMKAIVERIFGIRMNDKHVRPKGTIV